MQEARSRERYIKAPLRRLKVKAAHYARKVGGYAVKLFNKEKGDKILAGATNDILQAKLIKVEEKNDRKMRNIHFEYKAPMHDSPHGSGPPAPSQHHGSGYSAPPQHRGSGYPVPPQHHGSGYPAPPFYHQGPPVPTVPANYHGSVHSMSPFYPPQG